MFRNFTTLHRIGYSCRRLTTLTLPSLQNSPKANQAQIDTNNNSNKTTKDSTEPSSSPLRQNLNEFVKLVDTKKEKKSFAKLFKESKFVALGDLKDKYLIGKIVEVLGDDLYIDYGGKFLCVCKKPARKPELYVRNANVKIKLLSFEMSAYFLNAAKNITLLESDAHLVELYRPERSSKSSAEPGQVVTEIEERNSLIKKEVNELNSDPFY